MTRAALTIKNSRVELRRVPDAVGVYIFLSGRTPLYIGKSVHLRARLISHFKNAADSSKERGIIHNADRIKILFSASEFQALLKEAALIRIHLPKYNTIWKDDKSPLYIKITTADTFPKVSLTRKENTAAAQLFGPFSSARLAGHILREMRRVVPFCTQPQMGRVSCFYHHLGLCAPCPNLISAYPPGAKRSRLTREYRRHIRTIIKILNGQTDLVLQNLRRELKNLSRARRYEEAIPLRNRILVFERFINEHLETSGGNTAARTTNPAAKLHHLLQKYLPRPAKLRRIECYDISSLSQKQATAAMVVATDGEINKSQYRKFRIRDLALASDLEMLTETLTRRFRNFWPHPDLLVVDGGAPQVKTAQKVLRQLHLHIPIVGIAKKPDRLVVPVGTHLITFRPPANHPGFNLVRRLRDEAHRFSKKYHLLLRQRKFLS